MMASLRSYKNLLWKKREAVKNLNKSQFCVWKSVNAVQCFSQGLCPPQYRARSGTRCKIKLLNFFCPEILPRLNVVWFFFLKCIFYPGKKNCKNQFRPHASQTRRGRSNETEPKIKRTQSNPVGKIFGWVIEHNRTESFWWVRLPKSIDAVSFSLFDRKTEAPSRELRPNLQTSSHIWASEAIRLPKILILVHFFQKLLICPLKDWQIAWNLEFLRKELKKRCDYYE